MLVNTKVFLATAFLASTTLVQAFPAPALDIRQSWDFQQFGVANPVADPDAPGGGIICIGSNCPSPSSTTSTISTTPATSTTFTTTTTTTTTASVTTTETANGPANNGTTSDASNDGTTGGDGGEPEDEYKGTYYKPHTYGAEP